MPVTHHIPGLVLTDHDFQIPLDHDRPDGPTLTVFGREVVARKHQDDELPWLIFFQGGPGFPSPRPPIDSAWIKSALQEFRVLLLDQRGTGRSTPVTVQQLLALGEPAAQARYLTHFRADAIVRDAEWIRRRLLGNQPWSALGQSFGGFILTTYLSFYAEGLREVLITGGVPPILQGPDAVYRHTYRRVLDRNRAYYERYPEDEARVQDLANHLNNHDIRLPDGDRLTPRRLQTLGLKFGSADGLEEVHYLVEDAFAAGRDWPEINFPFLKTFAYVSPFDARPLYTLLHEPIYCQGQAANWAAQRVRDEFPEFAIVPGQRLTFSGEMIYPWFFEEIGHLRPLRETAEWLASYEEWPDLYDLPTLEANQVPVAAAVYYDDFYVERTFCEESAAHIGNARLWITNEYQHDGVHRDSGRVFERLLKMARGLV